MSDALPPLDAETAALLADERAAPGAPVGVRDRVRSRLVDCRAMIDRPSGARLAARTKSI